MDEKRMEEIKYRALNGKYDLEDDVLGLISEIRKLEEDLEIQKGFHTRFIWASDKLEKVELAEAKARMENEDLKELLMQMMQNGLEVKYVGGEDNETTIHENR